jgi:hypothetical protein
MADLSRTVWGVSARDQSARDDAFDALVIVHGDPGFQRSERHVGASVPFEGELPNAPLTLIVRTRHGAAPLLVDVKSFATDGTMLTHGRSTTGVAVIARSASGGIMVTGLPNEGAARTEHDGTAV